ncbi:MAG: tRNA 2-thiouridine(34) synthase MnmA [Clostridia bacterium]|nr:tRNA 2-thiouridine(34) synthase MnmA [Clostridia bacterium]
MKNSLDEKKVILGLSGGVDSTTAALVLKEQGYEVIAFYFDALGKGREEAERMANSLGIKFIYEDVRDRFEDIVIGDFLKAYKEGRTPNPCIICNPMVKFKSLIDAADREGAKYIATGHYAGITKVDDTYFVCKGKNEKKDQSYMLYRLGQDVLSRLLLPLYDFENKDETRKMAEDFGMDNAKKKDSQDICFLEGSYVDFLEEKGVKCQKGNFVDKDGNVLGEHQGIHCYTIGQRKGLGIALGKPAFVTNIDCSCNQVTLGDNEDLFKTEVTSVDNIFNKFDANNLTAKTRYTQVPVEAEIVSVGEKVVTRFKEPVRAITPGQSIVFYDGDVVIGGGIIDF